VRGRSVTGVALQSTDKCSTTRRVCGAVEDYDCTALSTTASQWPPPPPISALHLASSTSGGNNKNCKSLLIFCSLVQSSTNRNDQPRALGFLGRRNTGFLNFSSVELLAAPNFFQLKWNEKKMFLLVKELKKCYKL
jgi:hypothetical protein